MPDKKKIDFHGEGFDKDELTPEERAQFRHMRFHIERNFLTSEEFLKEMNLSWLAAFSRAAPWVAAIAAGATAIGALTGYLGIGP